MGGILFGAIAGGLAGAGQAGVSALAELQKYEQNKTLEEMRAELMYQKQKKLSELSHQQNVELEGSRQKATSEENVKERTFRAEQAKGEQEFRVQQFATELTYRYDLQGRELSAQERNSKADRESREKVAGMQLRAAEKPTLQQLSDGSFAWMDPKTGKAKKVVDAETGEEVRGKTDMTASQLASIGSLKAWAEKVVGRETSTPEERKAATHTLTVQIPRMLSDKGGPTPTAAAFTELAKGLSSTDPSVRATVSAEWDKAWKKNGYPIGAAIEHLKTEQVVPPKSGAVDPKKTGANSSSSGIVASAAAKPMDSRVSAYGALSNWGDVERAVDANDPVALKYATDYLKNSQFGGTMPNTLRQKVEQLVQGL